MTKARDCGDKLRHPDRANAEAHIWWLVNNRGARRARWMSYRCKHCDFWHVGHHKKRRFQK